MSAIKNCSVLKVIPLNLSKRKASRIKKFIKSKTFHEKCDDQGPTLTIILANSRVFGGYTNIQWSSSG